MATTTHGCLTTEPTGFRVDVAGESYTVWQLAGLAECSDPDTLETAGASFLRSVASSAGEIIEAYREDRTPEDRWDYSGDIHQVADGAPDVYTHTLWSEFVDLAAYREDPTEFSGEDMEQGARICLFMIAERLVWALVREAGPFDGEGEDNN